MTFSHQAQSVISGFEPQEVTSLRLRDTPGLRDAKEVIPNIPLHTLPLLLANVSKITHLIRSGQTVCVPAKSITLLK